MTNEQLAEIEALAGAYFDPDPNGEWMPSASGLLAGSVPGLIAEVRRLQGLIKQVEWSASAGHIGGEHACPWCRGNPECAVGGQPHGHKPTCPAFGSQA